MLWHRHDVIRRTWCDRFVDGCWRTLLLHQRMTVVDCGAVGRQTAIRREGPQDGREHKTIMFRKMYDRRCL